MAEWDTATGQFLRADGTPLPTAAVHAAVERIVQATQERVVTLTQQRLTGTLDTLAWRSAMQDDLRNAHMAATALAHGGLGRLTASDRGWAGARLRGEYGYLSGFSLDLAGGDVSDAQALVRASQYAQSVFGTYAAAQQRQRVGTGMNEARNTLGGAAHHCDECPALSARGWVPVAEMPPPGARTCGGRCRCAVAYRQTAQEAA